MQINLNLKLFVFLFSLISLSQSADAQSYICDFCGKTIEGRYIVVDGVYFHPDHFICSKCGKIISSNYNKNGKNYYHAKCYAELYIGKCNYCNKLIEGEYYEKDGKKYHIDCYNDFVALKCSICGELINGSYFTDYFGNVFHGSHEKEFHKCDNCHRLITKQLTDGGTKLSDGRYICHQCERFAVKNQSEISNIAQTVLRKLKTFGFNIELNRISIISADRDDLKKIAGNNYQPSMRGYCVTKIEQSSRNNKYSHKIFVLNSVPSLYIESTLAHEFMHVWINENTEVEHSAPFREGSCNYLSYVYLKQNYSKASKVMQKILLDDPSRDYGDGFRSVLKKVKGRPLNYLFSLLRKYKNI